MGVWVRIGAWGAGLLIASACVGLGAAPAAALEYEEVPASVQPVPIHLGELPKRGEGTAAPRTFTLWIQSGYCVGGPKPRIDHVRVVERPKTQARPYKSSVITAYLLYPAHLRVVPPPNPPPNVIYEICSDIGLSFTKRIKLKRPAADLRFFDGSESPPHRIHLVPAGIL